MIALGVKPGDEVIVPAHSWISTSETVTQAGAKVVFCDTNTHNFTIDTALIEEKITQKQSVLFQFIYLVILLKWMLS